MKKVLAIMAGLVLCGSASADMNPIGEFTGAYQENFDGHSQVIFTDCMSWRPFGDICDWCTYPRGTNGCHTTGGWSFYCQLNNRSSPYLFGSANGYVGIDFDMPMGKFGGWFGNHTNADGTTLKFYDETGALHAEVHIDNPADCQWRWYGFETTDVGFTRVEIIGDSGYNQGAFVLMDDLEADEFSGGGFGIEVSGDCPGTMTVCATGANQGDLIAIAYGFSAGQSGPVPGCSGLYVDIAKAQVAGKGKADANGSYCAKGNVPQGACGRVLVQAVNKTQCLTSAVVGI